MYHWMLVFSIFITLPTTAAFVYDFIMIITTAQPFPFHPILVVSFTTTVPSSKSDFAYVNHWRSSKGGGPNAS